MRVREKWRVIGFLLVAKAIALRRRAEEKQQEVEVLDRETAQRLLATKQ